MISYQSLLLSTIVLNDAVTLFCKRFGLADSQKSYIAKNQSSNIHATSKGHVSLTYVYLLSYMSPCMHTCQCMIVHIINQFHAGKL